MIWHIDELQNNSKEQMTPESHYAASIEQADGNFDLEKNINAGSSDDLFDSKNKKGFNDNTLPDAKWWSGALSFLDIHAISAVSDTMRFSVGSSNLINAPGNLQTELKDKKVMLRWDDQSLNEKGFIVVKQKDDSEFFKLTSLHENTIHYQDDGFDLDQLTKYSYRIYAFNDTLMSSSSNVSTVNTSIFLQRPYSGTAAALPGKIEGENFDDGGQDISYFDVTEGNQDFISYRDEAVEITYADAGSNGYCIELESNEWTEYTVDVLESGFYLFDFLVKGMKKSTFYLTINEGQPDEPLIVEQNEKIWQTIKTSKKIYLNKGTVTLRLSVGSGKIAVNYFNADTEKIFSYFPNPVKAALNLKHDSNTISGKIQIFDTWGRVLKEYEAGTTSMDMSDLPNGLYIVRLLNKQNQPYSSFKVSRAD
jgi:hypothetical protein